MGDDDRWMFLHTLAEMAGRTSILIHAFALMDNHYHLEANLGRKTARRYTSGELKAYDEQVAETLVSADLKELGLERSKLAGLPKNAPAKALLAHIMTEQTSVPQKWISKTLHMASGPYLSKLAKEMKLAMPRSKEWRDVKQRIIRFIT